MLLSAGAGFYPSRRGGHKNSENVATFSEFLGGRKNLGSAHNPGVLLRPDPIPEESQSRAHGHQFAWFWVLALKIEETKSDR